MRNVICAVLFALPAAALAADGKPAATFSKDVAPIFYKSCVECHRATMFAPMGDDTDLPAVPKMADGWTIGKPDAIFTMDEEFTIPATGAVPYQYFRVPTGLTEDKWIQAIEIKPGARAQVHHVIAFTQPAGSPLRPGGELGPTNIGGVTP